MNLTDMLLVHVAEEAGEKVLQRTMENDRVKDEYCKKAGIGLIRVKYTLNTKRKVKDYLELEISKFLK